MNRPVKHPVNRHAGILGPALLAVSLILLLILGSGGAGEEGGPRSLEYWSWDPEQKAKNEEIIAAFEEANPGITVELTTLEPSEYWTKIRVMAGQQSLPDVFNMSSGYLEEWASSDLLYNLDSLIAENLNPDAFYMSLFDAGRDAAGRNAYYAVPYALVTTVLFYNMDMFDEAGLSYPDSSWDWNTFLDAARALTRDTNGDGTIDQWGYWFYGRYAHVESWIYANNGRLIDRSTNTFSPDAGAMEALRFLTDLVLTEKVAPPKKEMSAFRQQDVFPQKAAAMWVDGSWNIANNRTVAGDSMRWGIAEIPAGPQGDGSITYGWPDYLAMAPNTQAPEAAWNFLKYLSGEGLTLDMYLAGKIPSYRALAESEDFLERGLQPGNKEVLIHQAAETMRTSFTLGWGEWRGYGAAQALGFNGVIDGIIDGEIPFSEGMETARENADTVLDRYYR